MLAPFFGEEGESERGRERERERERERAGALLRFVVAAPGAWCRTLSFTACHLPGLFCICTECNDMDMSCNATFWIVLGLGLAFACCFCLVLGNESPGGGADNNIFDYHGGDGDHITNHNAHHDSSVNVPQQPARMQSGELGDANSKLHAHVQLCALCLADNKALALAPRMRLWGVFFCCLFQ